MHLVTTEVESKAWKRWQTAAGQNAETPPDIQHPVGKDSDEFVQSVQFFARKRMDVTPTA
jgi:hypothetical protein